MAIAGAIGVALLLPPRAAIYAWTETKIVAAGFGVTDAEIQGHRFASEADIRSALALDGTRSHLALDLAGMQRRIEALPWVRKAVVRRVLPYAIAVDISERVPAAVWRGADRDVLVDAEGHTLGAVPRGVETGLPVLTGEDAGPAAASILPLLAGHRQIAPRLVEVRRIAGRRWTLLLTGGTLLHLPGDGAAAALAWIDGEAQSGLLDRGLAAIDLRVHGQIVVREPPEVPLARRGTSTAAAPTGSSAGMR